MTVAGYAHFGSGFHQLCNHIFASEGFAGTRWTLNSEIAVIQPGYSTDDFLPLYVWISAGCDGTASAVSNSRFCLVQEIKQCSLLALSGFKVSDDLTNGIFYDSGWHIFIGYQGNL